MAIHQTLTDNQADARFAIRDSRCEICDSQIAILDSASASSLSNGRMSHFPIRMKSAKNAQTKMPNSRCQLPLLLPLLLLLATPNKCDPHTPGIPVWPDQILHCSKLLLLLLFPSPAAVNPASCVGFVTELALHFQWLHWQ